MSSSSRGDASAVAVGSEVQRIAVAVSIEHYTQYSATLVVCIRCRIPIDVRVSRGMKMIPLPIAYSRSP